MEKITLQGVHNTRDLGGTPVQGGKIRLGKLIRSSGLSRATAADINVFTDVYHLQQVIDLRTQSEAKEAPDVKITGAEYTWIPLVDEKTLGITHDEGSEEDLLSLEKLPGLAEMYEMIATNPESEKWREIFGLLLKPRQGAVLWHCSEGKDRCGLVSAMVLYALGASMEDIEEDYLRTNEAAAPRAEAMYRMTLEKTGNTAIAEKVKKAFLAKKEYFDAAFAAIDRHYGNVESFLEKVCGVDEKGRMRLREM